MALVGGCRAGPVTDNEVAIKQPVRRSERKLMAYTCFQPIAQRKGRWKGRWKEDFNAVCVAI